MWCAVAIVWSGAISTRVYGGACSRLLQFADDERLERELEETRVREKGVYVERVQQQRDERMRMYEQEKASELADVAAVREAEEYKARVVAEARRRLLDEHAGRLDGFLPKSTLNTVEEKMAMSQKAGMTSGF